MQLSDSELLLDGDKGAPILQSNGSDLEPSPSPALISRRETLKHLSAGALLTLGLWPGCAYVGGQASTAPFRFLVVNDTHYMSPECGAWLEGVVRQMKTHPDVSFCLLAGDLTEHGQRKDLRAVRDIFSGLGRPVYVVIGNHDYQSPTERTFYERIYPRRLNYVFRHDGWQFIGLDTTEGQKYEQTRISGATFRWVDDTLRVLSKKKPMVVFTHFPLGEGVTYRPVNADALLERFLRYNLRAVFCGHFHGYTARSIGEAVATTNRCCALKRNNHDRTKEKGYFLCTASGGTVSREFIPVAVPNA